MKKIIIIICIFAMTIIPFNESFKVQRAEAVIAVVTKPIQKIIVKSALKSPTMQKKIVSETGEELILSVKPKPNLLDDFNANTNFEKNLYDNGFKEYSEATSGIFWDLASTMNPITSANSIAQATGANIANLPNWLKITVGLGAMLTGADLVADIYNAVNNDEEILTDVDTEEIEYNFNNMPESDINVLNNYKYVFYDVHVQTNQTTTQLVGTNSYWNDNKGWYTAASPNYVIQYNGSGVKIKSQLYNRTNGINLQPYIFPSLIKDNTEYYTEHTVEKRNVIDKNNLNNQLAPLPIINSTTFPENESLNTQLQQINDIALANPDTPIEIYFPDPEIFETEQEMENELFDKLPILQNIYNDNTTTIINNYYGNPEEPENPENPENPQEPLPETDNFIDSVTDKFIDSSSFNPLASSLSALQEMTLSDGSCSAPSFRLPLNDLKNVSYRFTGNTDNVFPESSPVFVSFELLEDKEKFSFMNMSIIEIIRLLISAGMLYTTFLYVWRKIVPDKVIGG